MEDGFAEPVNMTSSEFLEACAESIARDYPEWKRISRWTRVAADKTLMAFRIEAKRFDREGYSDFHFVIRENGEWWHKQGGSHIERFMGSVRAFWRNSYLCYNGKTAWFVLRDEEVKHV